MKDFGSNLVSNIISTKLFLTDIVNGKIKEIYGERYFIKGNEIFYKPKTYPYDQKVGHWFLKDDDLYMVINNDNSSK